MNPLEVKPAASRSKKSFEAFRRAVLRGLAIVLPPLLTVAIFLWIGNTVAEHLLAPLERSVEWVLVEHAADIRTADDSNPPPVKNGALPLGDEEHPTWKIGDELYVRTDDAKFIPAHVYTYVRQRVGKDPMPTTAKGIYTWYVDEKWLPREFVVPLFICIFLLLLYLLGKFLAAGIGRFFWGRLEKLIHHVPLVRNVYSSIKQVTDFLFTEPDIQYTRVVAIEYPRKGIWTLAFVTGEPMHDLRDSFGEPMISAFVPHSPMPFTGFAVTVKKSETYDLSITVDQALQFIVSCGVVVPPPPPEALGHGPHSPRGEAMMLAGAVEKDG